MITATPNKGHPLSAAKRPRGLKERISRLYPYAKVSEDEDEDEDSDKPDTKKGKPDTAEADDTAEEPEENESDDQKEDRE